MTEFNKELGRLQLQERMNTAYTKILSILLAAVVFMLLCVMITMATEGTSHKKNPKLEPRVLSGELYNA